MSSESTPPRVSVDHVSKCYSTTGAPLRWLWESWRGAEPEGFWALRDVSFEVAPGESVGIVGRNGSGKSTLLQMVAGTLAPTSGSVSLRGRPAAILELGSGFHPEFTGRENIEIQAQILGMTRSEVSECTGEIEDFAGIGSFIDLPVKTYSSGMYLRLAFAVAVHADCDILLIDEALAVGDERFQRKCYARLEDLRSRGVTLVIVSHSPTAVLELCDRALLLDAGAVLMDAAPKGVLARYHQLLFATESRAAAVRAEIESDGACEADGVEVPVRAEAPAPEDGYDPALQPESTIRYPVRGGIISECRLTDLEGRPVNLLRHGARYRVSYRFRSAGVAYAPEFGMLVKTVGGIEIAGMSAPLGDFGSRDELAPGEVVEPSFEFDCRFVPDAAYFLNAGVLGLCDGERVYLHRLIDTLMFRVLPDENVRVTGVVDVGFASGLEWVGVEQAAESPDE